ncbi:RNA polymerase sigma factor [Salmonirosea aquatica]|uniref:Sigma-70 family RNA polymerase sigma factor n=1 Tax=Salmonirosea aquatica TaxID=2654236 RepID=A0A7C9FEV8_9BACT|nr:sigma-70 family RNA polymerase sigma factor [Cytophagaceae bacterium SJW1-29]
MKYEIQDQTLWKSFLEGENQALGQLLDRYHRMLKHYGLKFMVDESVVEDCIQDLFLQLHQNRIYINDTNSVKHYLLKSLRSHIIQHLRFQKRAAYEELDWDSSVADEADSETLMIRRESLEQLTRQMKAKLATLPDREREALYLRYYENLSIPEIAEVMQVNRQSVSNFLQKALCKLRNQWIGPALLMICILL